MTKPRTGEPIAETRRGRLRGTRERGVEVYRGIPFAAPPLGRLRFRPPAPAEPWPGVRDASRFGPAAPQADRPLARVLGMVFPEQSEDCLTLNVWTPAAGDGGRRPVLVWVHGGAWVIGSGSETTYDGAVLAARGDAVVVTMNYRLGPFGFLRLAELGVESSGNEGLLDVVAALEWVRDEIAAFGGDPGCVTVLGNSAGAVNVACLLAMPRARGLFHRAVTQSGALNLTRTPAAAAAATLQILKEAGVAPGDAARLRELPAGALLAAANAVAGRSMLPPFSPVADGEAMPERPLAAIAAGSARGIPLVVGTNLEEMKLYRFLDPAIESLDEAAVAARCAALFPGEDPDGRPRGAGVAETYRAARAARGDDASPPEVWLAISTDHVFRAPALALAERHAAHTPQTWVYRFDWKGAVPGKPQGAIHTIELPFVFGTLDSSETGAIAGPSPAARALAERVQEAWLAFARTGRPAADGLPEWPPYAPPRRATLELGEKPRVLEAPGETERRVWDELFR